MAEVDPNEVPVTVDEAREAVRDRLTGDDLVARLRARLGDEEFAQRLESSVAQHKDLLDRLAEM